MTRKTGPKSAKSRIKYWRSLSAFSWSKLLMQLLTHELRHVRSGNKKDGSRGSNSRSAGGSSEFEYLQDPAQVEYLPGPSSLECPGSCAQMLTSVYHHFATLYMYRVIEIASEFPQLHPYYWKVKVGSGQKWDVMRPDFVTVESTQKVRAHRKREWNSKLISDTASATRPSPRPPGTPSPPWMKCAIRAKEWPHNPRNGQSRKDRIQNFKKGSWLLWSVLCQHVPGHVWILFHFLYPIHNVQLPNALRLLSPQMHSHERPVDEPSIGLVLRACC